MSAKIGECCPVLKLALERESKHGLELAPFFSLTGKGTGVSLILRFPRSKDRKAPHADATFAECSFCPFCGAKLERKKGGAR